MTEAGPDDVVGVLRRWERSGAVWRVVHRSPAGLEIELLTCSGDEVMGMIRSADPALAAFVDERPADDADPPAESGGA